MAARLTDKQKKRIIADYVELGSYNAVAKKHGVACDTVKRIVLRDPKIVQKTKDKKEANTRDVLEYMEGKRDAVCQLIELGLSLLPEKLQSANATQITTALGTLIDKFTMNTSAKYGVQREEDALTKSLREMAAEMEKTNENTE
ncbi:MAG: hypothetical protein J6R01_08275 [Alistipes sp.]|nr:hypothetical protein [Alistipes sp.]